MDTPATRYAKTRDGAHLAYQVLGDGPVDLALITGGMIGNLEADWQVPAMAGFLRSLASFSRLILHDRRGTGLSDGTHEGLTLESSVDDMLSVLAAAGSANTAVVGLLNGGAAAALFVAEHPELASSFVWYGPTARTAWAADYPWGVSKEQYLEELRVAEEGWGSDEAVRANFVGDNPSLVADPALLAGLAWLLRHSLSPGAALEQERIWFDIDVRHVLPSIRVPTLVIDREGVSPEEGAYAAALIPGCTRVVVPGADALAFLGDVASVTEAVREFLGVPRPARELDRVLTTVLFTDVVSSTDRVCEVGDARWKELLSKHNAAVRALLSTYRGTEVKTTGDGFLATFDGPARAVRCAQGICEAVKLLGIEVRAGCHTGEVELIGADVGGVAVHIGARVAALARPSEVLVSSMVKDLVAGSGLKFMDRGEHKLKGIAGSWQLYAAG